MEYKNKNYSFQTSIICDNGDSFKDCNFTQKVPHTLIHFTGNNITIIGGNITNCDFDCLSGGFVYLQQYLSERRRPLAAL